MDTDFYAAARSEKLTTYAEPRLQLYCRITL